MNAEQVKLARQMLGLNQTDFATNLGWTSKRNIVNLERGDKEVMTQTALAIECLLRRANKFGAFEMIKEIQKRLDKQKIEIASNIENFTREDIQAIVFGESDIVEEYLRENGINESEIDLEALRDLQHVMISGLEI